jgi:hypothetical protein
MVRMITRWFKRLELKGKIRDIDRDFRAVQWERSIMLAQNNEDRAERMRQIQIKLHGERVALNQELKKW